MENTEGRSRQILLSVIGVFLLVIAVVGISYAIWSQNINGKNENALSTGYVTFTYTESSTNIISIEDALPMSDTEGINQTGSNNMFDFTVSAKYRGASSIAYEVYATLDEGNTLDSKYIKVYLTDQNDNAITDADNIPTFNDLTLSNDKTGKRIYNSTLTSGESKKLRLRIWVSFSYDMPEDVKRFAFHVNVLGSM